jgi:hypothetical protein
LVPYDPSSSAYNLSEKMSNGTSSNLNSSNDANNISINDNIENGSSSNNFVQDKTTIILFNLYFCASIIDYENLYFPCFGSLSLSSFQIQIQIATT